MNTVMPLVADRGMGEPISLAALLTAGKKVIPDATELLIQDHREAMGFFHWFEQAGSAEKLVVANRLCMALSVHMQVEEEIFYPAARAATGDDAILDRSVEEHASAKTLMGKIKDGIAAGTVPDDKMRALKAAILEHVTEEETELFPKVRQANLDLYATGSQLAARRGQLLFDLTGKEIIVADAPLHMDQPEIPVSREEAFPIFVHGLHNAHAMERNCKAMVESQMERLENYPAVEARLRTHLDEKDVQIQRLEDILDSVGESPVTLKDTAGSFLGNVSSMMNASASDEILKNACANYAMANLEIATYESLLVLGQAAEQVDAIRSIQTSLSEERAMANWLAENLRETAVMFLQVRSEGPQASH